MNFTCKLSYRKMCRYLDHKIVIKKGRTKCKQSIQDPSANPTKKNKYILKYLENDGLVPFPCAFMVFPGSVQVIAIPEQCVGYPRGLTWFVTGIIQGARHDITNGTQLGGVLQNSLHLLEMALVLCLDATLSESQTSDSILFRSLGLPRAISPITGVSAGTQRSGSFQQCIRASKQVALQPTLGRRSCWGDGDCVRVLQVVQRQTQPGVFW